MNFNSYELLVFFPVVVLLYFVLPKKIRWVWLLISSYFFYMCWNASYALLIAASTLITWLSGLLIEKAGRLDNEKKAARLKKLWVGLSFGLNLAILFFFKYFGFTAESINALLGTEAITLKFDILLPVGISFYTFQALSYTMDVYRKEIPAEKNFFFYALFVSFFPQLVAGPIERSGNLLPQLKNATSPNGENIRKGLLLMGFGLIQKMVIADRIAIFVNTVYNGNINAQPGSVLLLATLLFGVQVYCDFCGYSNIARGAAQVLNINLMKNFNTPYFAVSVRDFWRRWHISLSTWFKDYLYFPLGGSKKGKLRKYINTFIVFLVSGIWHGANFTYIIWGALHGIFQILGDILRPVREFLKKLLHIEDGRFSTRLLQTGLTYTLVNFAWIFFRANTLKDAFAVIKNIFTNFSMGTLFNTRTMFSLMARSEFNVLILSLVLLLLVSLFSKKFDIRDKIEAQPLAFRWAIYIFVILIIMIFGVYGAEYVASDFIYFQF